MRYRLVSNPSARLRVLCTMMAAGLALGAPAAAAEPWPISVNARYKLKFQGFDLGKLEVQSETSGAGYKISGGAQLSVLLGAFKIKTAGTATGAIADGSSGPAPLPKDFAFDWQGGKKHGAIKLGFDGQAVRQISVDPPPSPSADTVPLQDRHTSNVYDPISAIMVLTRNDGKPCDKRVPVFDGKQRFDIVFSFKRQQPITAAGKKGGAPDRGPEMGVVCRVEYVPIAGHRQRAETEHLAKNRDMEVVLRRLPGTDMMVPHTVTIPTGWGTATMVSDRIDVVTSRLGRIALHD